MTTNLYRHDMSLTLKTSACILQPLIYHKDLAFTLPQRLQRDSLTASNYTRCTSRLERIMIIRAYRSNWVFSMNRIPINDIGTLACRNLAGSTTTGRTLRQNSLEDLSLHPLVPTRETLRLVSILQNTNSRGLTCLLANVQLLGDKWVLSTRFLGVSLQILFGDKVVT